MIAALLLLLACGSERWDVKTAKGDAATEIDATPNLSPSSRSGRERRQLGLRARRAGRRRSRRCRLKRSSTASAKRTTRTTTSGCETSKAAGWWWSSPPRVAWRAHI